MHFERDIYWGNFENNRTYYYGSLIRRQGQDIFFENLRYPSGIIIKSWSSRTNYQSDRRVPELPLLLPGATYHLKQDVIAEPADTVYFLIQFFNRQDDEIAWVVLKNGQESFCYPEEAFAYTIKMMNAGCDRLHFSKLTLSGSAPATNLVNQKESVRTVVLPKELELISPLLPRYIRNLNERTDSSLDS